MNHRASRPIRCIWQSITALLLVALVISGSTTAQENIRPQSPGAGRGLLLPSRTSTSSNVDSAKGRSLSASNGFLTTTVSLGLIVGTLLLAAKWIKNLGLHGPQTLPTGAFEVIGHRTLEAKANVHLVKFGKRLLLLGVSPDGIRNLCELDEPAEIEQLLTSFKSASRIDRTSEPSNATPRSNTHPTATPLARRLITGILLLATWLAMSIPVRAQDSRPGVARARTHTKAEAPANTRPRDVQKASFEQPQTGVPELQGFVSPGQLGTSLKLLALMTVFSLAPSIMMMTTCFVRFIVVLGLLRQALGTQQGPPNQVLTAICLFLTFLVMSPVWQRCYQEGIRPYTSPEANEPKIDEATACSLTLGPVRNFMSQQIDKAGNADAVWMLLDFQRPTSESTASAGWVEPQGYDDVPFTVLAPAYILSELKVGFLIGFQLFLPFLIIDLIVAIVLTSLGLTMLPPSMVSLPLKLLLFVLIDGWFLTVGMLLESVKVA